MKLVCTAILVSVVLGSHTPRRPVLDLSVVVGVDVVVESEQLRERWRGNTSTVERGLADRLVTALAEDHLHWDFASEPGRGDYGLVLRFFEHRTSQVDFELEVQHKGRPITQLVKVWKNKGAFRLSAVPHHTKAVELIFADVERDLLGTLELEEQIQESLPVALGGKWVGGEGVRDSLVIELLDHRHEALEASTFRVDYSGTDHHLFCRASGWFPIRSTSTSPDAAPTDQALMVLPESIHDGQHVDSPLDGPRKGILAKTPQKIMLVELVELEDEHESLWDVGL